MSPIRIACYPRVPIPHKLSVGFLALVVLGACSASAGPTAAPTTARSVSTSAAPSPTVDVTIPAPTSTATTGSAPMTTAAPSTTTVATTTAVPSTTTVATTTATLPSTATLAPATTTTTAPPPPAATTTTTRIDLVVVGREVASVTGCTNCHSSNGAPGLGPTWAGALGSDRLLADGSTVIVSAGYIRESIVSPSAKVVDGYSPGLMPEGYASTLTTADIDALVAYIASL